MFDYAATWDACANEVSGLEAFGELVYQQLWAALDEETAAFAAQPAPTWHEQERAALDPAGRNPALSARPPPFQAALCGLLLWRGRFIPG